MLNRADGACTIYPVRPFICRSHGAPIAIAREDHFPLVAAEFYRQSIEEWDPEFFILDDWNDQLFGSSDDFEQFR